MNVLFKFVFASALLLFATGVYALQDASDQITVEQTTPDQTAPVPVAPPQPAPDQATPHQTAQRASYPQIKPTAPGAHIELNAGMTYGGDTIYTARYTNGTTTDIKGGSMMQFGVGGLWQSDKAPVALMLSANFHFDSVAGSNGNVTFSRLPIEMLAYYTGRERFRMGGGIRLVNSPKIAETINGFTNTIMFDNTTGLVAEIGYQIQPKVWMSFRAVSEKYQGKSRTSGGVTSSLAGTPPISGSHLGVNISYEF